MVEFRRQCPQLTDGRLDLVVTEHNEEDQWLFIERGLVSILANFADETRTIPLRDGRPTNLLLASVDEGIETTDDAITLPGNSVAILGPSPRIRPRPSSARRSRS